MEETCFDEVLGYEFSELFYGMIMAYWVSYYLLSEKFLKKGIVISGGLFIATAYILSVFSRFSMVYIMEPIFRKPPFLQESVYEILTDIKALSTRYLPGILTTALVFYIVKYFSNYNEKNAKNLQLENEKTLNELKMLRAQLNPHFLFNTLNNIYSLSIDNSPKTSSAIGKLSEILDYILYRCDADLVSVTSELKLIEDYIELERLRYDDRLEVEVLSTIENDNQVPPLLFLSLVENAFKHGAGEDSGSPKIKVSLSCDKKKTEFEIRNTFVENTTTDAKDSIGLNNIKKQLDLLYANNYSLEITKINNVHSVILILKNSTI
ncbi:MAG: sensor histidine kinase [Limnohabitans sp.]|nr:sensor histidine kinase [Limnohabitans sp.]